MEFEATIILDVKLSAPSEAAARAKIAEILRVLPIKVSNSDARLRLIRPPDGRLIAVRPNLPTAQAINIMVAWSDAKTLLYGSCGKPRTRHQLFQAVHERMPLVTEANIATLLRELTVDGWLRLYVHNTDIDTFPTDDTRQQILALAGN